MKHTKKDLLYYWKLTKAIGAKKINYSAFDQVIKVDNDVFGVKWYDGDLLIVIAGSNDPRDWINNIRFLKLPDKKDVHCGFYHAAKKMRKDVENVITNYAVVNIVNNIILIGHSRGKALAVELLRHLEKRFGFRYSGWGDGIINKWVVGFNGPKEGGEEHTKECEELKLKVDLYQYPKDIVPKLPPGGFKMYGNVHELAEPWWFIFPLYRHIHCNCQFGLKRLKD